MLIIAVNMLALNKQKDEKIEKTVEMEEKDDFNLVNIMEFDEKITRDLRLHYYDCIKLNSKLAVGDYIDIRISFANGLDFIILPKKKIVDMAVSNIIEGSNENSLWLYVSEEEILRMSSAMVDFNLFGGCVIYAVKYAESLQESAFANYPVSGIVKKLIENCPNIVANSDLFKESPLRKEIEDNGEKLYEPAQTVDETLNYDNEIESSTTKKNISYNEDIIYLD